MAYLFISDVAAVFSSFGTLTHSSENNLYHYLNVFVQEQTRDT